MALFEQLMLAMKKHFFYSSMYFGPEHNHSCIRDSHDRRVGEQTLQEKVFPTLGTAGGLFWSIKVLQMEQTTTQRRQILKQKIIQEATEKFINVEWA